MSLLLPTTGCTPIGYRLRTDTAPNPLRNDKASYVDEFFQDEMPIRWLPEIFAEKHGGDTDRFVEGLRIMSKWRHFPLRAFVRTLLNYCESDRGTKQLAFLRSFSAFQVVSDHLAVNAAMSSADLLKDNLQPAPSLGNNLRNDRDLDIQDISPRK